MVENAGDCNVRGNDDGGLLDVSHENNQRVGRKD